MNDKINGRSLYTDIQFGQFRFQKMLYRVNQTELLQEPVFAQCVLVFLAVHSVINHYITCKMTGNPGQTRPLM